MTRTRRHALYCSVVCENDLVLAKLPDDHVPWGGVVRKLKATLKEHLGVRSQDILAIDGLTGAADCGREEYDLIFSGKSDKYSKFNLFAWDKETMEFKIVRKVEDLLH